MEKFKDKKNINIIENSNILEWIERGKKYIYSEKLNEWEKCVHKRALGSYNGLELNYALEIMDALNNASPFEEIAELLNGQNHSGVSYSIVMSIILNFSKNGPEFYEAIEQNISAETQQYINKQKELNLKYEKALNGEKEA